MLLVLEGNLGSQLTEFTYSSFIKVLTKYLYSLKYDYLGVIWMYLIIRYYITIFSAEVLIMFCLYGVLIVQVTRALGCPVDNVYCLVYCQEQG